MEILPIALLPTISLPAIALARVLTGFILLIAGMAKALMNGDRFSRAVLAYELLPSWAAKLLANWLPWLELAVGTLLVIGLWTKLVALVSMWLLAIFAVAVTVSLLRGKEIGCGCFGGHAQKMGWRVAVRNIVLLILSLVVYIHNGGMATLDSWLIQHFGYGIWPLPLLRFAVTFLAIGPVIAAAAVWKSQRLSRKPQSSIP